MLLDTNIVGYFFRRDTRAIPYEHHLIGHKLFIAFVTLAELYQWLYLRPFSELNRTRLIEHIREYTVLSYDDQLAWTWAELSASLRQSGRSISSEDSWIAATAIRFNLPLVTHNRRHFEGIKGLRLISENKGG
jgi:tRNA(fMet)-specific endonuclease VapC